MMEFLITESRQNRNNIIYIMSSLVEVFSCSNCKTEEKMLNDRAILKLLCPDEYSNIVWAEVCDKIAEIIVVGYKNEFFSSEIKTSGLTDTEKEILIASLIAADLDGDKKYCFNKIKALNNIAIDGVFNFILKPLKKKWEDILTYMPIVFVGSQLKEFVSYLLENKKERVYVDGEKVYDSHYKRLFRCSLLGGDMAKVIREVLLSNCGEVELSGKVSEIDEKYLKEFYGDKIFFDSSYYR